MPQGSTRGRKGPAINATPRDIAISLDKKHARAVSAGARGRSKGGINEAGYSAIDRLINRAFTVSQLRSNQHEQYVKEYDKAIAEAAKRKRKRTAKPA